jgi:3-oxoacid CoA-transferase subunit B
VVERIITDLADFDITADGLVLTAMAPEVTIEELRASTGAEFLVHSDMAAAK